MMIGGTGSSPPPGDPGLPQSPVKSYSQVASQSSRDPEGKFSNVVRYSPVADLQGGVASVDLPEELLSDSTPLWSAYIVGHFMGDVPHIAHLATVEASAQQSSTKDKEQEVQDMGLTSRDSVSDKAEKEIEIPENEEPWLTIPQSSPSGRRNNGSSGRGTEVEVPSTSSPSRFHLLSTELEEGEVEAEDESSSSEEESSVESKVVLEKRKQMEKQKLGKNKKNQKSNPNVNVGNKKDQTKGAKNKQTNHVSSRRH
ncbi:hypothetical protein IGI04_002997 [Brassica rapa subsp. trilocularis]|uniref:Uncharacterized protein n=1 Tax=Brassica rapa subsp. trilocularis TaxID=1813537 RepID=A0ABQ7NX54_BRACM|nr:hypothetical protein IGI04_002997 [Brassica rapa subsp. trilocularis]